MLYLLSLEDIAQMSGMGLTFKFYVGRQDYLFRGMVQETSGKDEKGKTFLFRREVSYPLVDPTPRLSAADFTFVPPPGAKLSTKKAPKQSATRNTP